MSNKSFSAQSLPWAPFEMQAPRGAQASGQSTVEYLVIIGVVVVLSLVVVGISVGLLGQSSGVSADSSKLFWASQPLGLSEAGADSSGDTFFVVTNNTGEDITLLGYVADGVVRDFTVTTPLIPRGGKKVVFIARQEACATSGSSCSLSNVSFKYRSATGLDKVSSGNDLVLEKQENVSVAMFDGQPTALVCVNNGDVGQCGSGGADTNSWTAGIINDSNIFQIDLNTTGNLKASGGYLCNASTCYNISDLNISGSGGGGSLTNPITMDFNIYKTTPALILSTSDDNGNFATLSRSATSRTLALKNSVGTPSSSATGILNVNDSYYTTTALPSITQDISISAWIKPTTAKGEILSWGWGYGGNERGFTFGAGADAAGGADGSLHWCSGDNGSNANTAACSRVNSVLSTGAWQHVIVTKSGTSITFYFNGVNAGSGTVNRSSIAPNGTNWTLGGQNTDPTYDIVEFDGILDEVIVYNKALDSTEVAREYGEGLGYYHTGAEAGFVTGYHVDEGVGGIISDIGGLYNVSKSGSGSSSWVEGKVSSPSSVQEATLIKSINGVMAGEKGINTFGETSGRTILDGQTLRFNIGGSEKIQIQSDGNIYFPVQDVNTKFNINDGGTVRTAIQINGAEGSVSFPRQSYVYAYRTTNQTIAAQIDSNVIYDGVLTDTLGEYNNTTGIFTAKNDGVYLVTAQVFWTALDPNDGYIYILAGGSARAQVNTHGITAQNYTMQTTQPIKLNAGQTIQIHAAQWVGGTILSSAMKSSLIIAKVA
ncbi:MAG: LamG-like jellyroll fold domain-containing protein [archaeon]|jgi:hypothetical protein